MNENGEKEKLGEVALCQCGITFLGASGHCFFLISALDAVFNNFEQKGFFLNFFILDKRRVLDLFFPSSVRTSEAIVLLYT